MRSANSYNSSGLRFQRPAVGSLGGEGGGGGGGGGRGEGDNSNVTVHTVYACMYNVM